MRNVLTYLALFFVAAVVVQFFLFDSMRLGVWFSPAAYVAFVVLLPVQTRPVAVLLLGFLLGGFVDFFEGTQGLHTVATLLTAYLRRWILSAGIGKELASEAVGMPSPRLLGGEKFFRYGALTVFVHCFVLFNLEARSPDSYLSVLGKTALSGAVTLAAVWTLASLFSAGRRTSRYGS